MGGFIIGIDLGGTKIAGALANSNGKIIKDTFLPTPKTSAINIYHTILKVIKELKIYCKHKKIYGIGFAVPGQIDLEKGIVINAPNLKSWNGFSLVTQLKRDLNLPIIIDNDANAAALAECLFGSGRKFNDFVYITVSTGIGSGIIINKKIFYG
ncbi:MAG: ROK family protein, partial [Candidatus Margulisbacteria bacterium]|nr:ROK family protein [Candidatus Margulisiibacteriota bacterium]